MPNPVGLPFALLGAERALKLGFFTAFVTEVPLQGVLPNVAPSALVTGEVAPNSITGRRRLPLVRGN